MAFLQVDGLTIPVATSSPRLTFEEVGGFSRAASGAGIMSTQTVKREWEIETTPLDEATATAFEALLLARGLLFQFKGNANASNGFIPTTATNLQYLIGKVAASPYHAISDVPFGHYLGEQSLELDQVTTNRLTANQSTASTDLTGATAYGGATVTRETGRSLDGNGCFKVVTTGDVGTGIELATTVTATTQLAGSVYLLSDAATSVVVELSNGITSKTKGANLIAGKWTRIVIPNFSGASSTDAILRVTEYEGFPAVTFYVDHAQVDRSSVKCVAWLLGGASDADNGTLDLSTAGLASFTWAYSVSFWARPDGGASSALFTSGASNDGRVDFTYGATGVAFVAWAGTGSTVTSSTVYYGDWAHVVFVYQPAADGGATVTLYVNGVLVGTASSSYLTAPFRALSTWTHVYFGSAGSTASFPGPLSNLLIVPCVLPASVVSLVYNSGNGSVFGAWPKHRVTGGILNGQLSIDAYARLAGGTPVDFRDSAGVWQAGRTLRFKLLEA